MSVQAPEENATPVTFTPGDDLARLAWTMVNVQNLPSYQQQQVVEFVQRLAQEHRESLYDAKKWALDSAG